MKISRREFLKAVLVGLALKGCKFEIDDDGTFEHPLPTVLAGVGKEGSDRTLSENEGRWYKQIAIVGRTSQLLKYAEKELLEWLDRNGHSYLVTPQSVSDEAEGVVYRFLLPDSRSLLALRLYRLVIIDNIEVRYSRDVQEVALLYLNEPGGFLSVGQAFGLTPLRL